MLPRWMIDGNNIILGVYSFVCVDIMINPIGALIIDLQGKELTPEERELLAHPTVGGVILFTRNYESRSQLKQLCHSIRQTRTKPLLILVDQEGGRVQRFIPEFTRLPSMGYFGEAYDSNPSKALSMAKDCGWLMAAELLTVGVDLSLAPVLDLNKGISSVIGQRAFHANPQQVITLADGFIQGMKEAGMAATGKHFPGHGSVVLDSHVAIPIDDRSLEDIEREDLIPFKGLLERGITALMAAHIIFPKVDKLAVGYSHRWLQTVLREQLKFKGVIFSDDLNMEGANISSHYADRVQAARDAGCDFTLLCNNRAGVIQVLDQLLSDENQVSQTKWSVLQGNFSRVNESYQQNQRWQRTRDLLLAKAW
jgi:beta-N-acetylhexosaminidase